MPAGVRENKGSIALGPPTTDIIDMVNYAQLSTMDVSRLSTAAQAAGTLSRKLSHHGEDVRSAADWPGGMWSGMDAMTASFQLASQVAPLYRASDAFRNGRAALEDLVDGITAAKEHLKSAQDLVAGTGITISADGTVTTPLVDSPTRADHHSRLAGQAAAIIQEALRMAEAADDRASASLRGASTSGDGGGDTPSDFFSDRFDPSISMDDKGNFGLGFGEAKNRLGIEGPSLSEGPFSLNSGSLGLTDNPYPGVSLDRWPPKISGPFIDVSAPNVSVDVEELGEAAEDTAETAVELSMNEGKRESLINTIEGALGLD